tara:strand:- start:4009 stop:4449 length:441 start_codon:yes stop_codon:yes gene_type:complete
MTNRADQIGTREWLEENNRRVIFQNHMYKCAGRDNPDHPMHGLFTGLWEDFCLNEAGKAQRDGWFERLEFVQKVESGEIKLEPAEPETLIDVTADPVDEYLNCSAECDINDQQCEDACVEELKQPSKENLISQADSPHQAAIAQSS